MDKKVSTNREKYNLLVHFSILGSFLKIPSTKSTTIHQITKNIE